MNHIEIKYSYLLQKAELSMNGEKASPYSELAAMLNRSFLESISHIMHGMDNEIFDDYEVDLYATAFHYEMLLSMAGDSELCKAIHFHEIDSLYSKEDLIDRLSNISGQYNISIDKGLTAKYYCPKTDIAHPQAAVFSRSSTPSADIGIFEEFESIPATIRTPLILSDSFGVHQRTSPICFYIPREKLDLFWEYYEFEFLLLPLIAEYLTALRYTKISDIHNAELNALKACRPSYYIGEIPSSIDQGSRFPVVFTSFPEGLYTLHSENPQVAAYQDATITAVNPGTANLVIADKSGESIAAKPIRIIGHQYAEEIRLIPRFEYLKRGERSRIDVIVTPPNAEDANQFVWEISNPKAIQLDESGNIIALEDGEIKISVYGHNVSTALVVNVKPTLQSLRFPQHSLRLKSGETVIIDCDVAPSDAPTENLTWEFDNKTIASINPSKSGKKCQIIASTSYEGKGNVRCYDSNTKLGAICNIEVLSKVRQGFLGKAALACCLIGILIPFLLPVSAIASILGLLTDEEAERHKRYIFCAVVSILILLFWIMAAMG